MSDTSEDVVYREIVGPSGAVYPIEPFRFVVGKTLVEMVDTYLPPESDHEAQPAGH